MNQEKVHNLIILDESGSMNSIKKQIISGFNEVVQTVKEIAKKFPEQEHKITFISFNAVEIKTHLENELFSSLNELNGENYHPKAGTPLYDAMGLGINKLKGFIDENTNVLVTILTDGMENSSKEYNGKAIKALVEELKAKNWTFTYIGTDHDVENFAASISIDNYNFFSKNSAGMSRMFSEERSSRSMYSQKIREKKDPKKDFYSKR